jgi:hypothetical protein
MLPPGVVAEVNRRATLMLCDGRAREGWVILVVWLEPIDPERFVIADIPPWAEPHLPERHLAHITVPGFMLSGFEEAWTKRAGHPPWDADFPG